MKSGCGREKGRQGVREWQEERATGALLWRVMRGYERLTRKEHMQARRAQVSMSTATGLSLILCR